MPGYACNFGCLSFNKSISNKSKNRDVGIHQTKNFCKAKETINKMKRQPTRWEKNFVKGMSDKGLVSKIYEELIQLNIKKKQTI